MKLLNLGCGNRFHSDWINLDLAPRGPGVTQHDFTKGLPFETESADAIYHAAVLEHVRKTEVNAFLREIYRVLKPGGIVRTGVPDLEKICRTYLARLERAVTGDKRAAHDYDWIMLEMLDQTTREKSGGEMLEYLREQSLPNEQFILERIGNEGRDLLGAIRSQDASKSPPPRRRLRDRLLALLGGPETARALAIGRFRLGGEVHHWMYDRFSLGRELQAAGFEKPKLCAAAESSIPGWDRFHLDIQPDGTLNKPDLLFMEAIKPGRPSHD